MKFNNPFKELNKFELILWLSSVFVISVSSLFGGSQGLVATIASLLGVTALIFIAKGMLVGQFFIMAFAILYGIVSFSARYYGEAITYVGMSLPMAVISTVSWIRHPHKDSNRVEVASMTPKKLVLILAATIVVTTIFFFVLKAVGNASLYISTLSIATSFIAASFTFLRSPYYAAAYAVNDIVLIVLWIIASFKDISNISMIFCFIMFLINDAYGFYSWKKMQKEQ